jgi:hypothetical protein
MVGIIVDANRMHLTKQNWEDLLRYLREETGRHIREFHTRDFYAGNGVWRGLGGRDRWAVMIAIMDWLAERKHRVVYSSVLKSSFTRAFEARAIPDELNSVWRFLGFHLILAMQKHCQTEQGIKGHTIFVFDNEERERMRFTDLILRPPVWSDLYYGRKRNRKQLDQIVDVPYFAESHDVVLIQLADFLAFMLRRYSEIKERLVGPRFDDEEEKLTDWSRAFQRRTISTPVYLKRGRQYAEDLFWSHAPQSIATL